MIRSSMSFFSHVHFYYPTLHAQHNCIIRMYMLKALIWFVESYCSYDVWLKKTGLQREMNIVMC